MTTCKDLSELIASVPSMRTRECIWHAYLSLLTDGQALEFGVFKGRSINYMAAVRPDVLFHGFDSFKGLPEPWKNNQVGHFATDLKSIQFRENIMIHTGLFDETLPEYKTQKSGRILQGIHIDCDVGSSTQSLLKHLTESILKAKPILLFDELYNYPGYENHEAGAFCDWVNEYNIKFRVMARTSHEQVLIQIL